MKKIIGLIIILPCICIVAPLLFIGVCVSEALDALENWLGE